MFQWNERAAGYYEVAHKSIGSTVFPGGYKAFWARRLAGARRAHYALAVSRGKVLMRTSVLIHVFLMLLLVACAESESTPDEGIQPMGIDSYISDTTGNQVCAGIDPPEGITEFHHQQCADWMNEGAISGCSSTVDPNPEVEDLCDAFFKENSSAECCCMLCGIKVNEPACFNLLCPGLN